jgi:hypothetical protein
MIARGAALTSGSGWVWDGPRNGVGGDAGARVAQLGSSFAFMSLVGFAVEMVVVTFGLVDARLVVAEEGADEGVGPGWKGM